MTVANFSKHENKLSYSHRRKRNLLTRRVSQIIVYAVKRVFQQPSKLKIANCLIVHSVSSSYYVTRFELGCEWKTREQRPFYVSNSIVVYIVSVNHEWMDANNIVSKCWFMRTCPTHEFSQTISHTTSKYMSQVSTKFCKTRFFVRQLHFYFVRYPANLNCDTSVSVVVSFLYESIHSFHNVSYGGIQFRFNIVNLLCFRQFVIVKQKFPLCKCSVHWWVRNLGKCYRPLSVQILLLWQKNRKWTERIVWKELQKCVGNQLDCIRIHTQMNLTISFSWNFPRIDSSCSFLIVYVGVLLVAMATFSKISCVNCGL